MRERATFVNLLAVVLVVAACQPSSTARQERAERIIVPAGTALVVLLDMPLSTDDNLGGDGFQATLAEPLMVQGQPILPGGTLVLGVLTSVRKPAENQPAEMTLAVTGIESPSGDHHPLQAGPLELVAKPTTEPEVAGVAAAGAAGWVPGGARTGDADLGTAPEAGTAAVVGITTEDSHVRLTAGQKLQFSLSEPTELPHPDGKKGASS